MPALAGKWHGAKYNKKMFAKEWAFLFSQFFLVVFRIKFYLPATFLFIRDDFIQLSVKLFSELFFYTPCSIFWRKNCIMERCMSKFTSKKKKLSVYFFSLFLYIYLNKTNLMYKIISFENFESCFRQPFILMQWISDFLWLAIHDNIQQNYGGPIYQAVRISFSGY